MEKTQKRSGKQYIRKYLKDNELAVNERVQSFLYVIADNTLNGKPEQDALNAMIIKMFDEGFELHSPDGLKKIGSKLIQQCFWRGMSKIKFLDFMIHCTGKDEATERLVKEGIATVANRGGLMPCFTDKGGIFSSAFLKGDGALWFGRGENEKNPVSFRVVNIEDVYANNSALGIRGVKPASRTVVILEYDKEEAYELYPELKDLGVFGRIPGSYEHDEDEDNAKMEDIVEIAYGYNKVTRVMSVFAGSVAHEIECYKGEEYPAIRNDKAYIPVFQFMCQPSFNKFWNKGIGSMVLDLAIITSRLMNMEVSHVERNVFPVTLINSSQSRVDELVEKMALANKAAAQGKEAFVAMEFGSGDSKGVSAQTLVTQNLVNDWQMIFDRLYKEVSRLGIYIDDVDRGAGYTRGQVIAEEQAAGAFVSQMQDYNASETEELIYCIMDAITEYVPNSNKTPLNLMTRLKLPDGSFGSMKKTITMGMLSKELKENNYFVVVNRRSGALTSDLMKTIKLERQLSYTQQGSPEFNEIYRQMAYSEGLDLDLGTPQPTPAPPAGGPPAPAQPSAPTPSVPGMDLAAMPA